LQSRAELRPGARTFWRLSRICDKAAGVEALLLFLNTPTQALSEKRHVALVEGFAFAVAIRNQFLFLPRPVSKW
jgi:hypothetical protein